MIELDGGVAVSPSQGEVLQLAAFNILPPIMLVIFVNWTLFDRELSSFFEKQLVEMHCL